MLNTSGSIYRNGKIELAGNPKEIINETRVIVTFIIDFDLVIK